MSATKVASAAGGSNHYPPSLFDTITVEVRWVDPAYARHLRDTCEFEWQRPINDRNVERLALEMKSGRFLPGTNIVVAVLPDNSMRLINGNHTLEAVYSSGVTIPLTFTYRRVPNLTTAGMIYALMDIQKVRTWRDSMRGSGRADFPLGSKVLSGVGLIAQSFKYNSDNVVLNQSRSLRFDAMEDYRIPAQLLHSALLGSPAISQRYITRTGIFAVALETARFQPSTAESFWSSLAMNDGLKRGDPQKALLRYCENHPAMGGSENNIQAKAAALAWNAYFRSTPLEVCKPNSLDDFFLLGTPWARPQPSSPVETGTKMTKQGAVKVAHFNRGAANAH